VISALLQSHEGHAMDTDKTCSCGKRHEQHICALHSKGMVEEAEHLTDHPTVTCAICLVNANLPDYVCSPTTLGGGFKYSDMKNSKRIICENVDPHTEREK
jgi:hypothetical protein